LTEPPFGLYRVIKKGDYEAQTLDDYIGTEVELNCGYAGLDPNDAGEAMRYPRDRGKRTKPGRYSFLSSGFISSSSYAALDQSSSSWYCRRL
jgi:hypothetical protein